MNKQNQGFTLRELLVVVIIVGFLFSVLLVSGSPVIIIQTLWSLLFGWLVFIQKILLYVTFNPLLIIEGIVTIIILVVGVHWFCSWFYQNYEKQTQKKWRWKWTITGVSVFMLMFIISISFTGLVHEIHWLFRSPLTTMDYFPYQTQKILENMGKAMEKYRQVNNHLPIALEPIDFKELKIPESYYQGPLIDEWGSPILYTSDGKSFVLKSYGENGILGGGTGRFDDIIYLDGLSAETGIVVY